MMRVYNVRESGGAAGVVRESLIDEAAGDTYYGPDSVYLPRFVQRHGAALGLAGDVGALYTDVLAQAPWVNRANDELRYRGNELKRTKAFCVEAGDDEPLGAMPLVVRRYRYPGWQWESLQHYRPIQCVPSVYRLVGYLNEHCRFALPCDDGGDEAVVRHMSLNHAIFTHYMRDTDEIGYHSDKVDDIADESLIVMVSLGGARELWLRRADASDDEAPDHVVVCEAGDAFLLGPRTNVAYKHAIAPVANERVLQRPDGVPAAERISIVLRNIKTTATHEQIEVALARVRQAKELRDAQKQAAAKRGHDADDDDDADDTNEAVPRARKCKRV